MNTSFPSNPYVSLDHIYLQEKGGLILKDVTLGINDELPIQPEGTAVNAGGVYGFLTPSDKVKRGFSHVLSGLQDPTLGSVHTSGGGNRGVAGYVASSSPLLPYRTVKENLVIAVKAWENNPVLVERYVMDMATYFNLGEILSEYPSFLTLGDRRVVSLLQRVATCSSNILVLEEPFSGLDPITMEKIILLIRKVAASKKMMVVFVTHEIAAACAAADRVWLLGCEHDRNGVTIPGATIVKEYDLLAVGLGWQPDIMSRPDFMEMVAKIRKQFLLL